MPVTWPSHEDSKWEERGMEGWMLASTAQDMSNYS